VLVDAKRMQRLGAAALEEMGIARVVDRAGEIRVLIIDAEGERIVLRRDSCSCFDLDSSDRSEVVVSYRRPKLPADVARQLRQEAGFGCAKCGHPYVQYHHIIPYAEEAHFRCEDMIALCGNCHPAMALQGRDRQNDLKSSPYNVKKGIFNGALQYDKRDLVFKVGGNWYENTPTIIQYRGTPIISCRTYEGQALVSLNLLDERDNIIFSVVDNDVSFRISDFWDFEYGHNFAIARFGAGDIALKMDFRGVDSTIEGNFWLGGKSVKLNKDATTFPGSGIIRGRRMAYGKIGIEIG
jgi:hypothetical protein